jgi:hypothetical protein
MIQKEDILRVVADLNYSQPTDKQIQYIIENYDRMAQDDPTGNLPVWIEQLLYEAEVPQTKYKAPLVNKYLARLREQYRATKKDDAPTVQLQGLREVAYRAMRLFCRDTDLISFNEIEMMEWEVENENQTVWKK